MPTNNLLELYPQIHILLYIYPHLQGYFDEADDYQFHGVFHMQENTPCEMNDGERDVDKRCKGEW